MGGCDGRCAGLNGSISPRSLSAVFLILGIEGQRLVDLGAGEGRVLAAALACGADRVFGYELPENGACKYVLDAVLNRMDASSNNPETSYFSNRASWIPQNIDQVGFGSHCSFMQTFS